MKVPFLLVVATIVMETACGRPASDRATDVAPDSGTIGVDNTSIRYVVEGAGRPCLVFGSPIYYPRTFSATFKSRFRCVHMQQRGFVADAPPPTSGRYSVDLAVADIEAVRRAVGLDRFVLFGHSMHGTVALAYALAHPDRVAAVIAIGAPAAFDSSLTTAAAAYWDQEATPGRKAAHRESLAALTADSLQRLAPGAAVVATYVANRAQYWADSTYDASSLWADMTPNPTLIFQLFDFANPYRFPTIVADLPPALVVLGRFDFVVPPTVWEGAAHPFGQLTTVVFERSGHTPQLEEPIAFDAKIAEWLAAVAPAKD